MLLGNNEVCSDTNDNNNGKQDTSIDQSSSGSSTVQLVQTQISEECKYLHIFFYELLLLQLVL